MRLRKRTQHVTSSTKIDNTPAARLKGRGLAYIDDVESPGRMAATANSGPLRNSSVGQLPIEVDVDPLLKDIVFSEDLEQKKLVMRLYTDMYYNDCVAGSIVDIKASLMFSEFTLGGILDRKVAEVFQENVERLNIRTLLPESSVDYDVKGAFVGSLLYNEERKVFVDIMPHGYENCKVDMLPFFGQDPLITVAFPESVRNTLNGSESPRIKAIREYLGPTVMQQIAKDALELDPKSTVYMPRKAFTNSTGVSYYRRILPIYLLEKNLFRGTLVESARRQRGILHITLDGNGEWEPTVADFNMITELFQNADADPLGAVIATRSGISLDETRQGGDFWKVTDVWDSTLSMKMKALGISESFLSGDATFSNQDTSLSFFIDGLRSQRDLQTRKILYNRIFPLISALNGFTLNNRGKLIRSGNVLDKIDPMGSMDILNDGTRLLIPSVHWAKTLKPEGDQSYLDMLQSLTEKGVPVPLRAMAAAGGFNLDMLLAAQEGDMDMTRRIAEYNKKVGEIKKEFGPAEAEGGADAAFAAANYLDNLSNRTKSDVLAQGSGRMVGLANRDYGEMFEVAGETHDGKKRYLHNQKLANERANRKIAKMLEDINQRGNTHLSRTTVTSYR